MNTIETYSDQEIVKAILNRDTFITKKYLYVKCLPMFSSIYSRYYTDCENVFEFINEMYLYILTPKKNTNRCKLSDFAFRCKFTTWLKVVAEHYCNHLYSRKVETIGSIVDDRNLWMEYSLESNFTYFDLEDVIRVLNSMPNERYRELIKLRYLEEMSNEDTAKALGLSMPNYYNMHLRAKAQFCTALRKEGLI